MAVSDRVSYTWSCAKCRFEQSYPVWRIVDGRERPDVLRDVPLGVAEVTCMRCSYRSPIAAQLVVIRPDNGLPYLLAVPDTELHESIPPSEELFYEAVEAADAAGLPVMPGPRIVLPRLLLKLVLVRDPVADAKNIDAARSEVSRDAPELANWYALFLESVCDIRSELRLSRAFGDLWKVPSHELEEFLKCHPELATSTAVDAARSMLAAGPPQGESDAPLRAQLRLIEGLATGKTIAEAARNYLDDMARFGRDLAQRRDRILLQVEAHPGPEGISFLREVLSITRNAGMARHEAGLSAELGTRLMSRGRVDDWEEAIVCLSRSLELIDERDASWPIIAGNLAGAYMRRVYGNPLESFARALELLERACLMSDRIKDPRTWSINLTNLGFLLADRPNRTSEDLDRGISLVREALQERSAESDPVDWGYSQLHLGLLHRRRGLDGDLQQARDCFRQGLRHLDPCENRELWIALHNDLSDALVDGEPPDLDGAEAALNTALAATTEDTDPSFLARLHWLSARIARRRFGPTSPHVRRGYDDALAVLDPLYAPGLYLRIGMEATEVMAQGNDWQAASDVFERMILAQQTLYDVQATTQGRRWVYRLGPRLGRRAAFALAQAGRLLRAVEVIEQSRAWELTLSSRRDTVDVERLAIADSTLAARWRDARDQYRLALISPSGPQAGLERLPLVAAAEERVQQVLREIREIPGFEDFLRPMTAQDISRAGGGLPIMYLINAPSGGYVLTVTEDRHGAAVVEATSLPTVSSTEIVRSVILDTDEPTTPSLLSAQAAPGIRRQALLSEALDRLEVLRPLIEVIARTVIAYPPRAAVVIPTGLLGLVPLHALPTGEVSTVLDDLGEIRLAPSAAVYAASRVRAAVPRRSHLVAVADTDPDHPLPAARAEVAGIQQMFGLTNSDCEYGATATRSWLLATCGTASHVHLACHGHTEWSGSLGGILQLAHRANLSTEDLSDGRLDGCRLAVASACQSGHFALGDDPDEFTGLPAGLLQAGASCAVVTLWQVDDQATALLMTRFYELLDVSIDTRHQQPIAALRGARMWLRGLTRKQALTYARRRPALATLLTTSDKDAVADPDERPFESAIYWAPFIAYGL